MQKAKSARKARIKGCGQWTLEFCVSGVLPFGAVKKHMRAPAVCVCVALCVLFCAARAVSGSVFAVVFIFCCALRAAYALVLCYRRSTLGQDDADVLFERAKAAMDRPESWKTAFELVERAAAMGHAAAMASLARALLVGLCLGRCAFVLKPPQC